MVTIEFVHYKANYTSSFILAKKIYDNNPRCKLLCFSFASLMPLLHTFLCECLYLHVMNILLYLQFVFSSRISRVLKIFFSVIFVALCTYDIWVNLGILPRILHFVELIILVFVFWYRSLCITCFIFDHVLYRWLPHTFHNYWALIPYIFVFMTEVTTILCFNESWKLHSLIITIIIVLIIVVFPLD